MKKRKLLQLLVIVLLAASGFMARLNELRRVFDPVSGLADNWAPASIIMAATALVAAAASLILAYDMRSHKVANGYHNAFAAKTPIIMLLSIFLAVLMIASAYLYYKYLRSNNETMIAEGILALFAVAAGIAYLTVSINAFRGKSGSETTLSWFVIVIFICYWLVVTYKQRAADPVILDYVYDALALCTSAIAAYFITGHCYERGNVPKTIFFTNLAVFFCAVAAAGAQPTPIRRFYEFTGAVMLISTALLYSNAKRKSTEPQKTAEFEPESIGDIPLESSDVTAESENEPI